MKALRSLNTGYPPPVRDETERRSPRIPSRIVRRNLFMADQAAAGRLRVGGGHGLPSG